MLDREVLCYKGLDTRVGLGSVDSRHFDCINCRVDDDDVDSICKDWLNQPLAATLYSSSIRAHNLIKFGRFIRLIELIDYLRSLVHTGVLCLRRLTKRIFNIFLAAVQTHLTYS